MDNCRADWLGLFSARITKKITVVFMKLNIDKILFVAVFIFSLVTFVLLVLVGVR